jgi:hypothetical protein
MRLKNLLHLYNDGHEPFGKGGLGYHPIRIYGDGFIIDNGELFWDKDDTDMTVKYYTKGQKMKETKKLNPDIYDSLKDIYNNEDKTFEDFEGVIKNDIEDIPESVPVGGTKSLKSAEDKSQTITALYIDDKDELIDDRGRIKIESIPNDYKICYNILKYIIINEKHKHPLIFRPCIIKPSN